MDKKYGFKKTSELLTQTKNRNEELVPTEMSIFKTQLKKAVNDIRHSFNIRKIDE